MIKRYVPACTTEGPIMAECSDEYTGAVWYSSEDYQALDSAYEMLKRSIHIFLTDDTISAEQYFANSIHSCDAEALRDLEDK